MLACSRPSIDAMTMLFVAALAAMAWLSLADTCADGVTSCSSGTSCCTVLNNGVASYSCCVQPVSTTEPTIQSNNGSIYIAVPAGKTACFQLGSTQVCVDALSSSVNSLASRVTTLESDMATAVTIEQVNAAISEAIATALAGNTFSDAFISATFATAANLTTTLNAANSALSAETTRAKAAESSLQSSITAEIGRAMAIETGVNSSVNAEATRAKV